MDERYQMQEVPAAGTCGKGPGPAGREPVAEGLGADHIVDLAGVTCREALHDALAAGLALPDWYGRNLDALHDLLGQMQGVVLVKGFSDSKKALGQYAEGLFSVLSDAAGENPDLTIYLRL